MTVQAKSTAPWGPVQAFTGREFVTYEWRDVPAGYEEAAHDHTLLEVRESDAGPETEPAEVDATGAAERLAAEHGIDLAAVEGSGEEGRVLVSDVRALIEEQ